MSYERKVRVVLHGYLKNLYEKDIILSGFSASEIINGISKLTKAFNPRPGQERHLISVVGFDTKESLFEPLPSDVEELHLVPSMVGGKKGGFFQVVLGAVLIATSIAIGNPAGLTAAFSMTGVEGFLFNLGISMLLGGLLAMLSPTPKADTFGNDADPEASKYLGATQNTVRIGTRIPIIYGLMKAFGHYLSFDVDAKDVDTTATA